VVTVIVHVERQRPARVANLAVTLAKVDRLTARRAQIHPIRAVPNRHTHDSTTRELPARHDTIVGRVASTVTHSPLTSRVTAS
jgi:hypothetical protein